METRFVVMEDHLSILNNHFLLDNVKDLSLICQQALIGMFNVRPKFSTAAASYYNRWYASA
jgi:hypothetical protein